MMENHVELQPDGSLVVSSPETGQRATLWSVRPDGFTAEQIEQAKTYKLKQGMQPGQRYQTRLFTRWGRMILLTVSTGPPTWWLPRADVRQFDGWTRAMVGWLRCAVMVSVKRES